jgi:hypothetical protein
MCYQKRKSNKMTVRCGVISTIIRTKVGLANLHVSLYIIEEKCLIFNMNNKFIGRDLYLRECTKKKKKKDFGQKFMNFFGVNKMKNNIS